MSQKHTDHLFVKSFAEAALNFQAGGLLLLLASLIQATPAKANPNQPPRQIRIPNTTPEEQAQQQAGWDRLRTRLGLTPRRRTVVPNAREIYLYGQQPVANQPSTTYFVFESVEDQVTGAFYMPASSFDCVRGSMKDTHMSLTITDSYTQQTHTYALALNAPLINVASNQSEFQTLREPHNIEGFHALPVTESDRALLATCQAIN